MSYKAFVHYFLFFFIKWQPSKNYEKCFSLHLKSSFRSRDIQIFVFPPSSLFLPVGRCFKWSKINLKVYDGINCLNKNSITHSFWYLEKEKRYGTETFSTDRILNKEHFYGKIILKICAKKLVHLNFGK